MPFKEKWREVPKPQMPRSQPRAVNRIYHHGRELDLFSLVVKVHYALIFMNGWFICPFITTRRTHLAHKKRVQEAGCLCTCSCLTFKRGCRPDWSLWLLCNLLLHTCHSCSGIHSLKENAGI